jgi:folate-binding protein YgfZ
VEDKMSATLADTQLDPSPSTSLQEQYRALTAGAALIERSHFGRLCVRGEDALDLLDRLSTNALADLTEGQGAPTVLTSSKGRIIDLLFVLREHDALLVLTGPQNRAKVADWIDFYTIVEDVVTEDVTEDTAMLSIAGPSASALIERAAGPSAGETALYRSVRVAFGDADATLIRTDFVELPGYDLVVSKGDAAALREALLGGGAVPVGPEALEAVRVERGVPASGNELTEAYNPLEAGLKQFISFTKGCYVGQEVVARLDTYDKVQKRLVGMTWASEAMPGPDARLLLDGKQVGVVTTAVRSPRSQGSIGLGYVRKAHAAPGTALTLELRDGEVQAQIAALPLVPTP